MRTAFFRTFPNHIAGHFLMYLSSAEPVGGFQNIADRPTSSVADRLHTLVADVFPDMQSLSARVDTTGGDHVVLVLGERFAFRFPRRGMHDLDLELRFLRELRTRSEMPTPDYRYVAREARFAGYEMIKGVELDSARLNLLEGHARGYLVDQLARFLAALHATAPAAVAPLDRWPESWNARAFADRIANDRLAQIARSFPGFEDSVTTFLVCYRQDRPAALAVIHGDLVAEHLLFDETIGRFAGVIDFSDVSLGDPAQDLLGLWPYGTHFVAEVVDLYDRAGRDAGLFVRSRNHFIRYRIDQLYELINDNSDIQIIAHHAAELRSLMSDHYISK